MKKIGYIDPYIHNPAVHCFNGFVHHFGLPSIYHMPATFGLESLFEHQDETAAYYIAGSASNVTDPLPWHEPLASFLVKELERGKPVLAACFGHQLLCKAFGSEVDYTFPGHEKLLGIRQIKITQPFWNYQEGEAFSLLVTHSQKVIKLGPDLLAVGEGLLHDIVIHKKYPLLATQAHPEASKHFCAFDIQNLSEDQETAGRRDGKIFIERFLRNFELL